MLGARMKRYPDFVERLLLHQHTLDEPLPTEPTDYSIVVRLREAGDTALLGEAAPADPALVPLLRGALYYYHNALDYSHKEVQKVEGDTAAYWHGMVHRREGDFENARYWMRRAGEHPAFQEMLHRASDGSPNMARQPNWDPFLFINLCEQFKFGEIAYKKELGHLQREEFAVMFDYVWRRCVAEERVPAAKAAST
jgi:hypothetical protein